MLGVEKIEEQGIDRLIPWVEMAIDTTPHRGKSSPL